jgi:hypothetical protein
MLQKFQLLAMAVIVSAMTAGNALALNADIDGLFTAIDVTTLKGNVITMVTAFLLISFVFVGVRYVRKSLAQAK